MTIYGGPDIVTDGLVLHLDAGNSKSYPGSGTSWFDLSGNNNHATLINGPTYSTSNKGSIVFDGSNDRGSIANNNIFTSNLTIETTITLSQPATNQVGSYFAGIFGLNGTSSYYRESTISISSNQQSPTATEFTALVVFLNSAGNTSNIISFGSFSYSNRPLMLTYRLQGTSATTFVNGNIIESKNITLYTRPSLNNLTASVGWVHNSALYGHLRGSIHYIRLYNKVLSDNEILQNYNALKGRYSL